MKIRVIGLGEIGIRVAANAVQRGHAVVGADLNGARLSEALQHESRAAAGILLDAPEAFRFTQTVPPGRFDLTVICVPTFDAGCGLTDRVVLSVVRELAPQIGRGEVVSIESTLPLGSTRGSVRAALEAGSGLTAGRDFFLVASPERIDTTLAYDVESIPKVLGGVSERCTAEGARVYRMLVREVLPLSSSTAAEATKLLENAYRLVNVAFVNELSELLVRLGEDPHEIIEAAATKPFGYTPFWPSVAAGGHCVPAAARSLLDTGRQRGVAQSVLGSSLGVNDGGAERIVRMLGGSGLSVLVLGLAYKTGSSSFVESPGIELVGRLARAGVDVTASDRVRPAALADGVAFVPSDAIRRTFDAVVVAAWDPGFSAVLGEAGGATVLFLSGGRLPLLPAPAPSVAVAS